MGINVDKSVKKQLKALISSSKLNDIEKKYWSVFIQAISEKDAVLIIETIQEDATVLNFLTENIEEKLKIIDTKNKNDWKNIIKKEKVFIESKQKN